VFVDDHAIVTGTTGTLSGNTGRTWYDGLSYARVEAAAPLSIQDLTRSAPHAVTLSWNSSQPLLLQQTFTVQRKDALTDPDWTTLATGVVSAGNTTTYTDHSAAGETAFYRVLSP
jgi:hypothetical protein